MTIVEETTLDILTERTVEVPDSGAKSGTTPTSTNLEIWTADRITKLEELAGKTFVNNSSFTMPAGVVTNGFEVPWQNGEKKHGINVTMLPLSPEGKPLSGTAKITAGATELLSKNTTGGFILSGPPLPGVLIGNSVERSLISFTFQPSVPAISVQEDFGGRANLGTVKYAKLDGTVTDYTGNPVSNIAVSGPGSADVTDSSGRYELLAPGGTSVTMSALGGTYEFTLTPGAGETLTQDIQYPQLTIRVLDADYNPVENAPVKIDGQTYETNASGEVNIPDAVLKSYDVKVMEFFEGTVDVPEAAKEFKFSVAPGQSLGDTTTGGIGGIKIKAVDARSGRPISDISVEEVNTGSTSASNAKGVAKVLTSEVGNDVDIRVGTDDDRYRPAAVEGTLPDGSMLEVELEIEEQTQVSNL